MLVKLRVMCLHFALGFSHLDSGLKMSSGKLVDSVMESSCLNRGKLDSQQYPIYLLSGFPFFQSFLLNKNSLSNYSQYLLSKVFMLLSWLCIEFHSLYIFALRERTQPYTYRHSSAVVASSLPKVGFPSGTDVNLCKC